MKPGRRRKLFTQDDKSAYLMIMPFFLFFIAMVIIPVLANLLNSFTDYNLSQDKSFIGLSNYIKLFRDKDFLRSLLNTAIYALFSVVPLTVLGFIVSAAVNRKVKAFKAANVLFIFPYVTSMVAVSMIWLMMYEPTTGIFNKLLVLLGFKPLKWLFDEVLALPALIAMNVWKNTGYVIVIYLAGLQSIPSVIYESATVDGASDIKKLLKITLPMLSNITFFVVITMCIEAFKTFDQVRIMTEGGPVNSTTTVVHQIYIRAFLEYKVGYASAMSIVLLLVVLAVTLLNFRFGAERGRVQ